MALVAVWPRPCVSRRTWWCGSTRPPSPWKPRRPSLAMCCAGCGNEAAPSATGTGGVAGKGGGMRCGWWRPSSIRQRTRRKAQKAGRTLTAPTLAVAGWLLLITTLDAGLWSAADVLYVYRARWQVELGFKKMKQLLRLNQIRSKHRTSVEATVRALLVAWALHEGPTTQLRTLLSATTLPAAVVVSSWLLSGLGLDTMRQQVQGTWSEARVQACLPCLCRFLCSRPRRRGHQESAVRAWLEQRASPHRGHQRQVA